MIISLLDIQSTRENRTNLNQDQKNIREEKKQKKQNLRLLHQLNLLLNLALQR